jgi:hypothetical protein
LTESTSPDEPQKPNSVAWSSFRALYGEKVSDPEFVLAQWRAALARQHKIEDEWNSRVNELRQHFIKTERQRRADFPLSRTAAERLAAWWKGRKVAFHNQLPWNKRVPGLSPREDSDWQRFLGSWLNRRILAQRIGRVFTRHEAETLIDMLRVTDREFGKYVEKLRREPEKWIKFFGE